MGGTAIGVCQSEKGITVTPNWTMWNVGGVT